MIGTPEFDLITTPLFEALERCRKRFVVNYGGAGSSKSYTQAQFFIIRGLEEKHKILILRKTGRTLKDSVIDLMVEQILPSLGLAQYFVLNKSTQTLTSLINGTQYLFRGLDDPEKIKSIAGITRIWMEEASEFTEADFDQLNLRLRGAENLQLTMTLNPVDEQHWIKKRFFDTKHKKASIIKSNYKSNPFLDDEYISELINYKETDYNYYRVYALGEWGKLDTGAEIYKHFEPSIHTREVEYNPDLPIHLSFDENVQPYITCLVWQAEGEKAWQIDEMCLEPPRNTVDDVCNEFKRRFMHHKAGLYIYGDATSRKSDTKLQRGQNFFKLIHDNLIDYNPRRRVPKSNPNVFMRTTFIDQVFAKKISTVDIVVGEGCKRSIEDFKYVKEAQDGSKLKEKKKDPKTGVTYELYGHCSDAAEYFICEYFGVQYNNFLKPSSKSVNYMAGKKKLRTKY